MNLNFFSKNCEKSISHVQHTIFISAGIPFHARGAHRAIFQISFLRIYRTTKVIRSTKKQVFQKIIKKQPDHKHKFWSMCTS